MFGLGTPELILILVLALVVFGPSKLPEMGKALGKGIREFKRATQQVEGEMKRLASLEESESPPKES